MLFFFSLYICVLFTYKPCLPLLFFSPRLHRFFSSQPPSLSLLISLNLERETALVHACTTPRPLFLYLTGRYVQVQAVKRVFPKRTTKLGVDRGKLSTR